MGDTASPAPLKRFSCENYMQRIAQNNLGRTSAGQLQ